MKISPQGTITFLIGKQIYEVNYDGSVLWMGPDNGIISGGLSEDYHHEFTRLYNGNYMVLGNEYAYLDLSAIKENKLVLKNEKEFAADSNKVNFTKGVTTTIIEYDSKGNVVWSWKPLAYLPSSDVINYLTKDGIPTLSLHDNSFFFNEHENAIYLGIRNISRILKIKYPEGNVISSYGEQFKPGIRPAGNGLFCNQHSCKVAKNGDIYLYDNHYCDPSSIPRIVKMEQPKNASGQLKEKWIYTCTIDSPRLKQDYIFPMGGNVIELPDGSLFSCMGGSYSKVFIVNMNKEILWSALPEK